MHYRLEDGEWLLNPGGEEGFGYGYQFNADGTYCYMMALTDIARQYLGSGVYRGVYRIEGDMLILSMRHYDFISKNRDRDTTAERSDEDEVYTFRFGIKYSGWGEGLFIKDSKADVEEFFLPLS